MRPPCILVEACMVGQRGKALVAKIRSERIDRTSAQTIDDAAFVLSFIEIVEKLRVGVSFWLNSVKNVWTIKARNETLGVIDVEPLDNVLAYKLIGCRRQSDQWDVGKFGFQLRKLQILRPEIMSPTGNTMCFVNCEQR